MRYEIEPDIFLDCYQHLLEDNDYDIEFLYGGRDSGKSNFVAQKLLFDSMASSHFRCILIKKTAESVKDSQWQTLKDLAFEYGIEQHFQFKKSPLEIEADSGAMFIARGCDDPRKLKSIRNPSCAWIEEGDQLTDEDFTLIITTLRSNFGRIKIYFVFNPELPKGVSDKSKWWLYKDWFHGFSDKTFTNTKILDTGQGEARIAYRATWTTYHDNPYVNETRRAFLENLKNTDPVRYIPYTLGEWGIASNENSTFYGFSHEKHIVSEPYEVRQDQYLDISFDFNINPCTAVLGQFDRQTGTYHVFDVILANSQTMAGASPLQAVCRSINNRYITSGRVIRNRIRVTGDASGKSGSADRQESVTFYYTIIRELGLSQNQVYVRGANCTHVYSVENINYALTTMPDGMLVMHSTFELTDDIRHAYMTDRSLDKAKREHGLHVLDAWRYLMDFWFSYHAGRFVTDSKAVQRYIDNIAKRNYGAGKTESQ